MLVTIIEKIGARCSFVARRLARLAGQVLSMQTALGLVCRVRGRFLSHSILPAAQAQAYGMTVTVSARARAEIEHLPKTSRHKPRPYRSAAEGHKR